MSVITDDNWKKYLNDIPKFIFRSQKPYEIAIYASSKIYNEKWTKFGNIIDILNCIKMNLDGRNILHDNIISILKRIIISNLSLFYNGENIDDIIDICKVILEVEDLNLQIPITKHKFGCSPEEQNYVCAYLSIILIKLTNKSTSFCCANEGDAGGVISLFTELILNNNIFGLEPDLIYESGDFYKCIEFKYRSDEYIRSKYLVVIPPNPINLPKSFDKLLEVGSNMLLIEYNIDGTISISFDN